MHCSTSGLANSNSRTTRAFLPSASQALSFVTETSLEMVGSAAVKVLRVFVLASVSAPVAARTASKLRMNTEYFVLFICWHLIGYVLNYWRERVCNWMSLIKTLPRP